MLCEAAPANANFSVSPDCDSNIGIKTLLIDHAILTRFNLPSPDYEERLRNRPRWLEERFKLFERYCLPCVAQQSSTNFKWIIYFDPASPAWAREIIRNYERQGLFYPRFRAEVPRNDLLSDIRQLFPVRSSSLLTTNLDNDDMITKDFVHRLQAYAVDDTDRRVGLNFPRGYTYAEGRFYRHVDKSNAFASMLEPWNGAITIWCDWHTRLARHAILTQVDKLPAWAQVIHGRNVSNRVRGWLVDPAIPLTVLAVPAAEVQCVNFFERALDFGKYLLLRSPREAGRFILKSLFLVLLPKEGLHRVRLLMARVTSTALADSDK